MDPCSSQALGMFGKLPSEVRISVWEHLMTPSGLPGSLRAIRGFESPASTTYEGDTAVTAYSKVSILRANRALYAEITCLVYSELILSFELTVPEIFPRILEPGEIQPPQTIIIRDQHRKPIYQLRIGAFSADEESSFWNLPFLKLKAIRFVFAAPTLWDPGNLVRTFMTTSRLLDLLKRRSPLPGIEIDFQEWPLRSWKALGRLNRSVPPLPSITETSDGETTDKDKFEPCADLDILLTPFTLLRQIPRVSISIPDNLRSNITSSIVREIQESAVLPTPVKIKSDSSEISDEEMQVSEQDDWHQWFEYLLDDMTGSTAALLRLERFASWSKEYELQFLDRLNGKIIWQSAAQELPLIYFAGICLPGQWEGRFEQRFKDRYRAMRAFNPMGTLGLLNPCSGRRKMPFQIPWDPKPGGYYLDRFDKDAWHKAYTMGIPRISSREYASWMMRVQPGRFHGEIFSAKGIVPQGMALYCHVDELDPDHGGWCSSSSEEWLQDWQDMDMPDSLNDYYRGRF